MDRRELLKKLVGVLPGVALTAMVLPAWARPAPVESYVSMAEADKYWNVQRDLAVLAKNYDWAIRVRAQEAIGKDVRSVESGELLHFINEVQKMMGKEYVSFGYGMSTSPGNDYVSIIDGIHWQVEGLPEGNAYDLTRWAVTDDGHWYMIGTPPHLIGA